MTLFSKPLEKITKADLDKLIADAVPEGDQIEFKERLSASKKGIEPWSAGQGEIGEKGRDSLLREVVALANAYGGHVLLGIGETSTKPPRAAKTAPLRDCVDLAERVMLMARDCIDPQLPVFEAVGVPTGNDGAGVVVMRVPKSRMAPHMLKPTKECYFRRSDRSEPMNMREIQDLTLSLSRHIDEVEKVFQSFRIPPDAQPDGHDIELFLRATGVPVGSPVSLESLPKEPRFSKDFSRFKASLSGGRTFEVMLPLVSHASRPILRGDRTEENRGQLKLLVNRHLNGAINTNFFVGFANTEEHKYLVVPWAMRVFAETLLQIELIRRSAGAPNLEYGIEFEFGCLCAHDQEYDLLEPELRGSHERVLAQVKTQRVTLPRYSVGAIEEHDKLFQLLFCDVWNFVGHDPGEYSQVQVDLSPALEAIEASLNS